MLVNVTVVQLTNKNASALCTEIGFPLFEGIYFPVARLANPRDASFWHTLSRNEHTAFIVASVLYSLMLFLCLYRLCSLFLWSLLKNPESQLAITLRIPKFAAFFLSLFFLFRVVYFVLSPAGVLQSAPTGVKIFLAEFVEFYYCDHYCN